MPDYTPMDWQLLAELSHAIHRGQLVPVPVLRLLAVRGWVRAPSPDDVLHVNVYRRQPYQEPLIAIPQADYCLGAPRLTLAGERELALFAKEWDYDDVSEILDDDTEDDES